MSDALIDTDTKKLERRHGIAGGLVGLAGIAGLFAASSALTGGLAGFAMGAGWYYGEAKGSTFKERLPKKSIDIAFALALTSLTTALGGIVGAGEAAEDVIKTYPEVDMNQMVRLGDVCPNMTRGVYAINIDGVDYHYTCP